MFINALAESGIVGMIGFGGIIFFTILYGIKTVLVLYPGTNKLLIMLVSLSISVLFLHQTCYLIVAPWFWVVLSILFSTSVIINEKIKL